MAINTQKFLPSSTKVTQGGALVKASQKVIGAKSSRLIDDIGVIKVTVIEIDSLLKGTLALKKKQLDQQKRLESSKRREKQEEKLETKPQAQKGEIKVPTLPKMGFLERIKNFIGNIILGYFAVRMIDYLPKLIPIVKFLGTATDFVIDSGGKLLNGLVTFVDWGYKAYDKTNEFLKNLGGENFSKVFEGFSGALGTLIETAVIATVVIANQRKDFFGTEPSTKPTPKGGKPRVTTGTGGKPRVRLPGTGPRITGLGNKALLSSVRPFLKRVRLPIIGALLDFGLSVALGEDPGRAAFKAVGAGLLGAVGAAAGTIIPFAGNFIGGLVGGIAGDAIGGALYDIFFGGKTPQKPKVEGRAEGGITRGGPKRTIGGTKKKGKYKRVLSPKKPGKVEITSPGASVGGEEKIFGIFPKPKLPDVVNPFKVIKDTGDELGKTDYFGPILAISSKITAGQLPTQQDYQNAGVGINLLIAEGIKQRQLKGGLVAAFAEGGLVDPDVLSAIETGGDVSNWVAKTFKGEIESNAQKTLRMIRENAGKKSPMMEQEQQPLPGDEDELPGGGLTPGQWGPLLDVIRSVEGGWESISGSSPIKGLTGWTIQEVANKAPSYAGAYQLDPRSVIGWAKDVGLTPKDKFTPENQNKIAIGLIEGRAQGKKWVANQISDAKFGNNLASIWAGLPVLSDVNGKRRGQSYYAGVSWNKANTSPERVETAFKKVRKGGYSLEEIARSREKVSPGSGKFGIIEYITGDRNHPNFDLSDHGLPTNYHDHIAFQTEADKERAKRTLIGAGIKIGSEFRPGDPGYHGKNLAIDIPGYQWGGKGTIGEREFAGSRKVRSVLEIGTRVSKFHGGVGIVPKGGMRLTLHDGEMYKVIDKDSVNLLGFDLTKSIIDIENKSQLIARAPSIIEKLKAISGYTDYEQGQSEVVYVPIPVPVTKQQTMTTSSGLIAMSGGSNPFETLYRGT
jgi:hypothetical protein